MIPIMWTCSHCGKDNQPDQEFCTHCGQSVSDEYEETDSEAEASRPVQDSDWTPLQFNIKHIIALTAILGLAFAIIRVAWDLSASEVRVLFGFGVTVGTIVFVPAVIYWLFKSK
jgi:uncharacterized membrane protein YvbJ